MRGVARACSAADFLLEPLEPMFIETVSFVRYAATSLLYTSGFLYPGPNRTCAKFTTRLKSGSGEVIRTSTPQARMPSGDIYKRFPARTVDLTSTARAH